MIFAALSRWWALPARVRLLAPLAAIILLALGGMSQPPKGPASTTTGRLSPNVVVVPMDGLIDTITSISMRRRIAEADASGADALVIRIDSPGGDLGAVLEVTAAVKQSTITRTIAWVNPIAHGGGAATALACQEIVVSNGSTFGYAAPAYIHKTPLGGRALLPLTDTRGNRQIAPLLADVVGSARKNGHDEKLVQGMVAVGVRLWLVEDASTGERLFIDRAEYAMLFDGEPASSGARLVGPPSGRAGRGGNGAGRAVQSPVKSQGASPTTPTSNPTDLIPASPRIGSEFAADASMGLTAASTRRVLTGADKGKWKLVEYVSDGASVFTLSDTDMRELRVATERVNTIDELKQYLGAANVITLDPPWYESVARVMQNEWIRGFLIVAIILGLFIEFVHPGLILPGAAAGVALLGLLLPELLMGLAGWWEVVMIVGGIALIGVELFLLPGVGVAGGLGLVSLLAGLVLAFIPASAPTFPGMERSSASLLWGLGFVAMGIVTAGTIGYYMSKNMRTLPVLGRLILTDRRDDDAEEGAVPPFAPPADAPVAVGHEGVAITTLRPSGKADFDGRVVDVVADGPMVQPGQRVRVLVVEQMRVVVEAVA